MKCIKKVWRIKKNQPKLNVLLYWHWINTILLGAVSVIGLVHAVNVLEDDIW